MRPIGTGFLGQELVYAQSNGTVELRERVAAMYPGATVEHVEVTNGGSEANFVTMWHLVEPGDEVVCMVPNYGQTLGLAEGLRRRPASPGRCGSRRTAAGGASTSTTCAASSRPGRASSSSATRTTRPARASPRPTSTPSAQIAGRVGAWVLSDEIYRGAELDGVETPSVWGRYERAIITSGLSKAYGLPGLRIGWIVEHAGAWSPPRGRTTTTRPSPRAP